MSLVKLQNEVAEFMRHQNEQMKLKSRLKRLPERIKNKMSNARYLPQIDSVYVYNLNRPVKFTHREQPESGYRYKNRHVLLQSKENEIHIYHQSAKIGGVIKGITMVTLDGDEKRVKKFFREVIEQIKSDESKTAIFNVAVKPVQLDIFHLY